MLSDVKVEALHFPAVKQQGQQFAADHQTCKWPVQCANTRLWEPTLCDVTKGAYRGAEGESFSLKNKAA